jgi:uncharacterized glyoxalase superfamily protein PhnB
MDPTIFPALRYRDAEAALDWLTKAFGFEERTVSRGPDGSIAHAELTVGGGMIMLGTIKEDGWLDSGPPDPLACTISVYVVVDDAAAHYEQARTHGATIVRDLEEMDYGSTEYSARDPEGNLWSFGTYDPYA